MKVITKDDELNFFTLLIYKQTGTNYSSHFPVQSEKIII